LKGGEAGLPRRGNGFEPVPLLLVGHQPRVGPNAVVFTSDQRAGWLPNSVRSAQALYQDLVEATRSAEINSDDASRHGVAKATRDELQRLALDITQWASHSGQLQKNELLDWRITDLDQRTARLVRGSGKIDVNPF
jgi:hypothetical protein